MKCPYCSQHTPDAWGLVGAVPGAGKDFTSLTGEWMRCANPECSQAVIRMNELHMKPSETEPLNFESETHTWFARPRSGSRPVDPLVKDPYRRDYLEAASILDLSPRMSAVLSRPILGDLLEEFAGQTQFSLTSRIDKFIDEPQHPGYIRENLHHFREVADFGAHSQKDGQAQIIDISREEAEWTLDILDSLFEYFIIAPDRSRKIREAMDKKIDAAGRKPISARRPAQVGRDAAKQ